jgi:hypothetical protein
MDPLTEMNPIRSKIVKDDVYFRNRQEMSEMVGQLEGRLQMAVEQGKPKDIARHVERGQLLGG